MLITIDRSLDLPLADQIAAQIRLLVAEGSLPPESSLPSSREFARRLGVDRHTVARAYARLEASGHVDLSRGRRAQVRALDAKGANTAPTSTQDAGPAVPAFDLRSLSPDRRLLPQKALQQAMRKVFEPACCGSVLDYANPRGDPGYLEMLARRLRRHGIDANPANLVATNGAQQAFDLLLRVLLRPGDTVAVETPGYASLLSLLRLHGARVVGIPMLADGMDLVALERVLSARRVVALFTMPCFQNPTGISTSATHRRALAQLCADHEVPLVEDGFLEDLRFIGRQAPPIKALDAGLQVIYVGTFSKLLWPGLRLGWVLADPQLTQALAGMRETTEWGGLQAAQQAMTVLQEDGTLDRYVRRAHREYRQRLLTLVRAVRLHLEPVGAHLRVPDGGFVAWVQTPLPVSKEPELMARMARAGILAQAGSPCHVEQPDMACVRLSVARCDAQAIDQAIPRIAQVMAALRQDIPCG